jgi:hypothetical protein
MPVLLPHVIEQQKQIEKMSAYEKTLYADFRGDREQKVVEWLMTKLKEDDPDIDECFTRPHEYTVQSYDNLIHDMKDVYYADVPETIWRFFSFDDMAISMWKNDDYFIVIDDVLDCEQGFFLLEDVGKTYPLWAGREEEYFKGLSMKGRAYLVKLDV